MWTDSWHFCFRFLASLIFVALQIQIVSLLTPSSSPVYGKTTSLDSIAWLTDKINGWLTDGFSDWLILCLTHWQSAALTEPIDRHCYILTDWHLHTYRLAQWEIARGNQDHGFSCAFNNGRVSCVSTGQMSGCLWLRINKPINIQSG